MNPFDREDEIEAFVKSQPTPVFLKRLPIIRHVRAIVAMLRINRHYQAYAALGMLPVNADLDCAVVGAIWRGEK